MELREALSQITEIRVQMARTETFRGYRSATVGFSGLLAFAGAIAQAVWIPSPTLHIAVYLTLWIAIAALSVGICGIEMAVRSLRATSPLHRQIMRLAIEQFVPCLAAGVLLTGAIARFAPEATSILPGLWAVVFSLGVFASCRLLPWPAFGVAAYYLTSGVICLATARGTAALSPWAMAATFGVGQLAAATVLYFALEKNHAKQ